MSCVPMQLHRLIIVPAFLWEVLFACSTFAFIVNTRTAKFASAHWRDLVVVAAAMKGPIVQPPNRPNACTYWVSENLMAGEYPGGKYGDDNRTTELRLQRYLSAGITVFLDLTNQGERMTILKRCTNKLKLKESQLNTSDYRFRISEFPLFSE